MPMTTHRAQLGIAFIGGGPGSFVGPSHFLAATLDQRFRIETGVFSQTEEKNAAQCDRMGIATDRRYADWRSMLQAEIARPDGVRAVGIITPNDSHFEMVAEAMRLGFHVICDKPLTRTADEARQLAAMAASHSGVVAVTYNYSGYPAVRAARAMIRMGEIGTVRRVHGQFPAGYLTGRAERNGSKQALWRTDPAKVGASAALMDIGTHAHHLIRFTTGLEVTEVMASLTSAYDDRHVDDNAEVILRLSNGATGSIWVSMIAAGYDDHGPGFLIAGSKGTLQWGQNDCNSVWLRAQGEPERKLVKGGSYFPPDRNRDTRHGFGPPEGFTEAFANIYRDFADAIAGGGKAATPDTLPLLADGLAGLLFVEAGAKSSATRAWCPL
jgi:predicted dehydrogenase